MTKPGFAKTVIIDASALPTTLTHVEDAFGDGARRRRGGSGGGATASASMAGAADGSSLISGEPHVPSVGGTLARTNSGQTRESVAALSESDSDSGAEETCVYQGPVRERWPCLCMCECTRRTCLTGWGWGSCMRGACLHARTPARVQKCAHAHACVETKPAQQQYIDR